MPYKRRGFRRRTFKKSASSSKKYVTWKSIKKYISKTVEHKYKDTDRASTTVDATGNVYCLSVIPQGDTDSQRNGDSVMPVYLRVKGSCHGADSSNVMRVILIRWHPDSASVGDPALTDILQSTILSTTNAPYAPYIHDKRNQFTVLSDRRYTLMGSVDSSKYISSFDIKVNLKRRKLMKKLIYTASDGTTGTDQIYICALSDSTATSHPAIAFTSRLSYTDS